MSAFVIVPDPKCLEFVPLQGWRALVAKLFPRLVRRPRWVRVPPPPSVNRLVCHPSTVPWLKAWLERQGHTYTQEAAILAAAEKVGM